MLASRDWQHEVLLGLTGSGYTRTALSTKSKFRLSYKATISHHEEIPKSRVMMLLMSKNHGFTNTIFVIALSNTGTFFGVIVFIRISSAAIVTRIDSCRGVPLVGLLS